MAKIPPQSVMFPGRGISIRGEFYTRIVKGKLVASKWPRAQPTARTPDEKKNRDMLGLAATATKYMSAGAQQFARDLAHESKLLPRDFLLISLFNRIGYVVLRDGRKIYAMVAVTDVSNLLDAIAQQRNALLIRGEVWWEAFMPGAPGTVLTVLADGSLGWEISGGGGGGLEFMAPMFSIPTASPGSIGGPAMTARPMLVPKDTVLTGVRLWVMNPNGAHTINPGLYLADPSTFSMAGATLAVEGPPATVTPGLMSLPFDTPYTAPDTAWYWGGVNVRSGSDIGVVPTQLVTTAQFFLTSSHSLPSPAPSVATGTGNGQSFWFY